MVTPGIKRIVDDQRVVRLALQGLGKALILDGIQARRVSRRGVARPRVVAVRLDGPVVAFGKLVQPVQLLRHLVAPARRAVRSREVRCHLPGHLHLLVRQAARDVGKVARCQPHTLFLLSVLHYADAALHKMLMGLLALRQVVDFHPLSNRQRNFVAVGQLEGLPFGFVAGPLADVGVALDLRKLLLRSVQLPHALVKAVPDGLVHIVFCNASKAAEVPPGVHHVQPQQLRGHVARPGVRSLSHQRIAGFQLAGLHALHVKDAALGHCLHSLSAPICHHFVCIQDAGFHAGQNVRQLLRLPPV